MRTKSMYRYLEKYVGTYRVKPELDWSTGDFVKDSNGSIPKSFDDLYIPCKKGVIKHSYEPEILCWCCYDKIGVAHNVIKEIKDKYPKLKITIEDDGTDVLVFFNDSDIEKIATIVKPSARGKNYKIFSKHNTEIIKNNKFYVIPEEDMKQYNDLTKDYDRTNKMHFGKQVTKNFDDIIQKKKGKKYNVKLERDNSGLKSKEFIHSIGMWEEFIKFAKKEKEQYDSSR